MQAHLLCHCSTSTRSHLLLARTNRTAGTPQNVTYYGGIGKVTVLWESPAVDPDPLTTKYRLYATPVTDGRRRLLDEGQTSIAALVPARGDGTTGNPFNATVYLPGEMGEVELQRSGSASCRPDHACAVTAHA